MARGVRGAARRADRHLPGLLDRRQLLHLDRPRRRPPRLEPAGRGARRRSTTPPAVDAGGAGAGARGGADRRRQRLVLVVRRRPFVGPRPRVRRPVPAPPPERLPAAREADPRRAVRQQHLGRRAAAGARREPTGAAHADARRRGDELLRMARRRARSRSATSAGAMHQTDRRPPVVERSCSSGSTAERLFVRLDGDRPLADLLGRRATSSALKFLQPRGRPVLGPPSGWAGVDGAFWDRRPSAPHWVDRAGPARAAVAAGDDPRSWRSRSPTSALDAGGRPRSRSSWPSTTRRTSEVERHPAHRPIETGWCRTRGSKPRHWTA